MADWKQAVARLYNGIRGEGGVYCGTVFMISDRWLLTCWHVVRGLQTEKIYLYDANACQGGGLRVKNIVANETLDVALLELRTSVQKDPKCIALPVDNKHAVVKDRIVESAGYASEDSPWNYFSCIIGEYSSQYNLYVTSIPFGKGMSGAPVLYQGELVGISRLQDDKKTYLIPLDDFQDLLKKYVLTNEQILPGNTGPVGTRISTSQFDKVLRKKINNLFEKEGLQAVKERIFERADRKPEEVSIGDLLCSADVRIEQAIGWLTRAAAKAVQDIPCEEGLAEQREALKENARKILGWLVLRAVDSSWVETNGHRLSQKQNAQVSVRFAQPTGVEVVVARVLKQRGNFQGDSRKLRGRLAVTSLSTEGGIEAPDNEKALFELIWKKVVRIPPLEEGFKLEKHLKTLQDCLESRYWTDTFDYLTLPVDGPKARLSLQEIQKFHQKIPFIKLVLLQGESGQSALLLDDGKLHWQIARFFEQVIEERND